ncbi:MAG: hypothetical protein NZ879_03705 [Archaeoglobaceae archaeon]|nr:hypothetical protein [Archaeoglobaceae archaeon]MDW8118071.1 hypothetical protein [Archaeoglobaceae archaeon]
MLSVLIVADSSEWHQYKELEECLINEYYVEYADKLSSEPSELSKLEFSYDIFFYLKMPETSEISPISRLLKSKIFIFLVKKDGFSPLQLKNELLPVADKILLKAAAMRGKIEYFRGVDEILAFKAHHIEPKDACEVILNGNRESRAMLGDIVFRAGKNVVFGVRKNNVVAFSADIFSNECLKSAQNCRFIKNLLSEMLTGVEFY